jgi:hypothetical protein
LLPVEPAKPKVDRSREILARFATRA